mgnify:CR=1 FL=1|tara:strand:- start:970 stop:1167 length:198 start_codon:yes stop_codon:yes gene_type:complete
MTWKIHGTNEFTKKTIYSKVDGNTIMSGTDEDSRFQEWLKENKDNLPTEIDKKVKDGTLIIKDVD